MRPRELRRRWQGLPRSGSAVVKRCFVSFVLLFPFFFLFFFFCFFFRGVDIFLFSQTRSFPRPPQTLPVSPLSPSCSLLLVVFVTSPLRSSSLVSLFCCGCLPSASRRLTVCASPTFAQILLPFYFHYKLSLIHI